MEFRIGDKVKFLNEEGQGVVTRIIDKKLVGVMIDEGFELPVMKNELIKIEADSDMRQFAEPEEYKEESISESYQQPDITEEIKDETRFSVFLAFVPKDADNPGSSNFNLYLINDSNYAIYYMLSYKDNEGYSNYLQSDQLEDNTKVEITSLDHNDLGNWTQLDLQALAFRRGRYRSLAPLHAGWKINHTAFHKTGSFTENDFFHENAMVRDMTTKPIGKSIGELSEKELQKIIKEKEQQPSEKIYKSPKGKEDIEEVDLHIHELVDDYKDLSNAEMLEIQMGRFQTTLEGAIKSKTRKIVYIHGVGNGRLKHEIRKTIDRKYPRLRYQDASFKEYGYGATMVIIN